jgi:hypothetical protein
MLSVNEWLGFFFASDRVVEMAPMFDVKEF